MTLTATVLTDAYINIGGTVISDHGNKIELPISVADLDTTCFGQTWRARVGGLKDATLNITLLNDFSASQLDSLFGIGGTMPVGSNQTFEIRPTSAARSATNPAYTGTILINSWTPLSGSVGDLDSVDVSWPTSGAVLHQTS
jgi:hypothetical protein